MNLSNYCKKIINLFDKNKENIEIKKGYCSNKIYDLHKAISSFKKNECVGFFRGVTRNPGVFFIISNDVIVACKISEDSNIVGFNYQITVEDIFAKDWKLIYKIPQRKEEIIYCQVIIPT